MSTQYILSLMTCLVGVEIFSPISNFCEGSAWRETFQQHWDRIEAFAEVDINYRCSTHVHLSPGLPNGQWTLTHLRRIAYAILSIESALERISLPSRRSNEYAKANLTDNINFRGLSLQQYFNLIGQCSKTDRLCQLLQPQHQGGGSSVSCLEFR